MNVIAVVVTMDRPTMLNRAVDALTAEGVDQTIVVNNGRVPLEADRRFVAIEPEENLGPAGGFRVGIERALEQDPDAVWLFNDDDHPLQGALQSLSEVLLSSSRVGAVGAWALCRGSVTRAGAFYPAKPFEPAPDTVYDVDYSAFCGLLARASALRQVGGPRADWFFYGEEHDLCLRLRDADYRVCILGRPLVATDAAGSSLSIAPWRAYYGARNGLLLARWRRRPLAGLSHMWRITKVSIYGLRSAEGRRALPWRFRGVVDGVLNRWGRLVEP